jgi:predicted ATP-dependent endonuclease of OLD family
MQLIVVDMLEQLSRQHQFQVLLSTHSKEIINYVEPSILIPVHREGRLGPLNPHSSAVAVLEELGSIDNVDLYSLFASRRCCFVEGRSDETLLKRLSARVGSTIFEGDSRVVLIRTGGVDNFAASAAVSVFSKLAGVEIEHLTVRDRDGLPDELRTNLIDRSDKDLHIHERDSIESYLISAPAFAATVNEHMEESRAGGGTVSEADLQDLIDDASEGLKDEAADRIANALDRWHAREERKHLDAGELSKRGREVRDEVWHDRSARLRFIPGKRILARCREIAKERYGVSLSDQALLANMDIETELAELVALIRRCEAL